VFDLAAFVGSCRDALQGPDPRSRIRSLLKDAVERPEDICKILNKPRLEGRLENPTSGSRKIVQRVGEIGPAWGVAICRDLDSGGFVLFSCADDWLPVADTWHATLKEAKREAESEYEGVSRTWEAPP
jgi:hypothetical protein